MRCAVCRREKCVLQEQQRARFERMRPYVESTGADGVCEVVDEVEPSRSR